MAIYPNQQQEDDLTAPVPPSQAAPTNQKVIRGGTPFQDVSRYLSQNQAQTQRLGSKAANTLVNAGNEARDSLRSANEQFGQQLNTSRIPYNQQLATRVGMDPRSFYSYPQQQAPTQSANGGKNKGGKNKGGIQFPSVLNHPQMNSNYLSFPSVLNDSVPASTQPQEPVPTNQADIDAVRAMLSGTYSGPTDLTGFDSYQNALTRASDAERLSREATNPSSAMDLVGSRNPFDAALLGSGSVQNAIEKVLPTNEGLSDIISQSNTDAATKSGEAVTEAAETRDKFNQYLFGEDGAVRDYTDSRFRGPSQNWDRKATTDDKTWLDSLNRLLGSEYNFGDLG